MGERSTVIILYQYCSGIADRYVPGKKPSVMHFGGGTDRVVSDHNLYLCIHVYRRWVHGSISVICTWSVSDL